MNNRKDALVLASKLIIFINKLAKEISQKDNRHFVATVGKIEVSPNYMMIIPADLEFIIDLRVVNETIRDFFSRSIKQRNYKIKKIGKFKN